MTNAKHIIRKETTGKLVELEDLSEKELLLELILELRVKPNAP